MAVLPDSCSILAQIQLLRPEAKQLTLILVHQADHLYRRLPQPPFHCLAPRDRQSTHLPHMAPSSECLQGHIGQPDDAAALPKAFVKGYSGLLEAVTKPKVLCFPAAEEHNTAWTLTSMRKDLQKQSGVIFEDNYGQ